MRTTSRSTRTFSRTSARRAVKPAAAATAFSFETIESRLLLSADPLSFALVLMHAADATPAVVVSAAFEHAAPQALEHARSAVLGGRDDGSPEANDVGVHGSATSALVVMASTTGSAGSIPALTAVTLTAAVANGSGAEAFPVSAVGTPVVEAVVTPPVVPMVSASQVDFVATTASSGSATNTSEIVSVAAVHTIRGDRAVSELVIGTVAAASTRDMSSDAGSQQAPRSSDKATDAALTLAVTPSETSVSTHSFYSAPVPSVELIPSALPDLPGAMDPAPPVLAAEGSLMAPDAVAAGAVPTAERNRPAEEVAPGETPIAADAKEGEVARPILDPSPAGPVVLLEEQLDRYPQPLALTGEGVRELVIANAAEPIVSPVAIVGEPLLLNSAVQIVLASGAGLALGRIAGRNDGRSGRLLPELRKINPRS